MKKTNLLITTVLAVSICTTFGVFAAPKAPKLHKAQELSFNISSEPEALDPAKQTGVVEANVILNCFEGLTRNGAGEKAVPGVAENWTASKDGLVYTFNLRKNAKWSNGDPVTAGDFEYAWKRALNPETASEYAYQLYYIKNGEAYNTKKITDPNQLGIKVINNYKLEVTLEAPCPYFLQICYFSTLMPLHKKTVENNEKWATTPQTYISNGPFKLINWVHRERLIFEPNPNYWNRKNIKLTKLTFTMLEDQSTALTMWETNKLDIDEEPPAPELPRLIKEKKIKYLPELATYFYRFNVTKAPFNDVRVRKALALAIDRKTLVTYVTKGGQKPATALVPYGIGDANPSKDFRQVGGAFIKDADIKEAKKLLAAAGFPNGKGFPTVELLYNTNQNHKMIAEAIQEMWKKNLGINVTLVNQEWKVYLDTQDNLSFQICRAGWSGDYVDPMTFMDMFVTKGGNNDTGWSNKKYDALIDQAKNTGDPKVRMQAMHDAEKILMAEMPIAPIYFYTRPALIKSWAVNAKRSSLGFWDFSQAYIAAH